MSGKDLFTDNDPFGLPALPEEKKPAKQAAAKRAAPAAAKPENEVIDLADDAIIEKGANAPFEKGANAPPEFTVSELSQRLKRTVEEVFSFVRVRGELSRITIAKSGHLYTDLKDSDSVLNAICWKGTVSRLSVRPEEGMEVVVTGRLTTYPGRSNYQLIIETMELAGQGALLKMLEERKKKLAAEGLFDAARKKPLPFLPRVIGVITSPTGAVIRDIMHRLEERFPSHVLLWPVMVQGQGAAKQVAEAIAGFNSLPKDSPHRPDLLIVARGGGSLEDLMPFNDEIVVRAAAGSGIPLISAVGHETDTTLIDYAADLRAPTPTAAAEKAVPVRRELMARLIDDEKRLYTSAQKQLQRHHLQIQALVRGLGSPSRLFETAAQRVDHMGLRLDRSLTAWLERKTAQLHKLAATLPAPRRKTDLLAQQLQHQTARLDSGLTLWLQARRAHLRETAARLSSRSLTQKTGEQLRNLDGYGQRLAQSAPKIVREKSRELAALSGMLESLSYHAVLARGYSVVRDMDGNLVTSAKAAPQKMQIEFADGKTTVKKED